MPHEIKTIDGLPENIRNARFLTKPEPSTFDKHMKLLDHGETREDLDEIVTVPIFTESVRLHALDLDSSDELIDWHDVKESIHHVQNGNGGDERDTGLVKRAAKGFSQYGLLAGDISRPHDREQDSRIFYNISPPSSTFICGSQGSGKSHSLSCMLENCLLQSEANELNNPLTGLLFHYDTFISDTGGSPCEAAYLSSHRGMSVRILCAPTNIAQTKRVYKDLPNVSIEELRIKQTDLNTQRMLNLMAVSSLGDEGMPLYMRVIIRILRELRIEQQKTGCPFDYGLFKCKIDDEPLLGAQKGPLQQRLQTLESFMVQQHAQTSQSAGENKGKGKKKAKSSGGTKWEPKAGRLTIVDLSCPCVTADMACSLFGICLSLFLEQTSHIGKVIALDEAHKYMTESSECQSLTESLLSTIRLQRHLGARIIISTQEPTISPRLLDLCSVTIVHRFTSPDWLEALAKHLAGASAHIKALQQAAAEDKKGKENGKDFEVQRPTDDDGIVALALRSSGTSADLFSKVVSLRTGEALLLAPTAAIGVASMAAGDAESRYKEVLRLGNGVLKVRIRKRVTADGGMSIMAV